MPGKRRRNSMAADSSPASWNAVRIASASASVTRNMLLRWRCALWLVSVVLITLARHRGAAAVFYDATEARLIAEAAPAS